MKKLVKVEFVSSLSKEKGKWYNLTKLLNGQEWAAKLQDVIDDYRHRGFRLIDTQPAYVDGKGSTSTSGDIIATGMMLFFESLD